MHVQHRDRNTHTLAHGDRTFTALRDGIFDVPAELGLELIHRDGWEPYLGEPAYEVSAAGEASATETEPPPVSEDGEQGADTGEQDATDWYAAGRAAAEHGLPRSVPADMHPRSRDAREFFRGYDEAKATSGQEPAPAE